MPDYFDYSYTQLRNLCRDRGLGLSGKKIDLIDRLEDEDKQKTSDSATAITTAIMPWVGKEQDPTKLQRLPNHDPPPATIMRNGYGWKPIRLVGKYIESYTLPSPALTLTLHFTDSTTATIHASITLFTTGSIHIDSSLSKALKTLTDDPGDECLEIVEATLGRRTTEVEKCVKRHGVKAWRESHVVLGLRLEGMKDMGWVEYRDGKNERWDPQFDDVWLGAVGEEGVEKSGSESGQVE